MSAYSNTFIFYRIYRIIHNQKSVIKKKSRTLPQQDIFFEVWAYCKTPVYIIMLFFWSKNVGNMKERYFCRREFEIKSATDLTMPVAHNY